MLPFGCQIGREETKKIEYLDQFVSTSDCAQHQHQFLYDSIEKKKMAMNCFEIPNWPNYRKKRRRTPKAYDALLSADYHVSQESVLNLEVLPLTINILQSYMIQIEGDWKNARKIKMKWGESTKKNRCQDKNDEKMCMERRVVSTSKLKLSGEMKKKRTSKRTMAHGIESRPIVFIVYGINEWYPVCRHTMATCLQ